MRRIAVYLFFDPQGRVDDYVLYKLSALREQVEHIHVVSNSPLDDVARARFATVADAVVVRENVGFDVWGYKESLIAIGRERLATYDELILLNYTFFGPVTGSFAPLFAEMDADPTLDFWGITDHAAVEPHPIVPGVDRMEAHIQSHWIAVRRSMFNTDDFRAYWDDMPMIESYNDSIMRHEAAFTHHFDQLGYRHVAAFHEGNYDTMHPVMDNILELVEAGCPIVKRRYFFHEPQYSDTRGMLGRDVVRAVEQAGYPVDLMLGNLARTSKPRNLITNVGLVDVLPLQPLNPPAAEPLRITAVLHVYYPDMLGELLELVDRLPSVPELVITTADDVRATAIRKELAELGRTADVRIVASNRGRDISAFLIGCRDVLERDDIDLLVKLHTKRSPQDGAARGSLFKRHLFENLLGSEGYAANIVDLFRQHPTLGLVLPPVPHVGYPTLGHSWFGNRNAAEKEAARLGIVVPFDDHTPVATYGSMFIARPEALRPLLSADYDWDDFPDEGGYKDGTLAHVLERLIAYAALSEGYHVREVMSPHFAGGYYSSLETKLAAVTSVLPAANGRQVPEVNALRRSNKNLHRRVAQLEGELSHSRLARAKTYVNARFPAAADTLRTPYRRTRSAYRRMRSAR